MGHLNKRKGQFLSLHRLNVNTFDKEKMYGLERCHEGLTSVFQNPYGRREGGREGGGKEGREVGRKKGRKNEVSACNSSFGRWRQENP